MLIGGFFDISEAGSKRKIIKSAHVRVVTLLIILCLAASIRNYPILYAIGTTVFFLCVWAGIKWRYVFLRMLFLIPFGLGAIILLPFSIEGKKQEWIWGLTISEEGLSVALLLISKLFVCHFILCLLLSTTSPTELFHTMRKIGVPIVIIEIIKITMRYLAVLFDEIDRMVTAQQARGLTFKTFASWRSYKRSGELMGVLLIRSYHRSIRVHEAMISRGFNSMEKEMK